MPPRIHSGINKTNELITCRPVSRFSIRIMASFTFFYISTQFSITTEKKWQWSRSSGDDQKSQELLSSLSSFSDPYDKNSLLCGASKFSDCYYLSIPHLIWGTPNPGDKDR